MDQIRLDPQDKLPPTPRTRQQNTLPPQYKKVPAPPPPQDNFRNSPKCSQNRCVLRSDWAFVPETQRLSGKDFHIGSANPENDLSPTAYMVDARNSK